MAADIDGFDHALIGVADLEAAHRDWQNLGFTLCPRGRHIGWGTANYCIMFEDDYLELLGIVDPAQFTNNLDVFLEERGEGLLGMAFATPDPDALAGRLGGTPQDLKRLLELPEGPVEPRFRLLHPPPGTLPGLSGFFCHHLTPDLMRRAEWLSHDNGAVGVASISVAVDDPTAARADYERVFGAGGGKIHLHAATGRSGLTSLSLKVRDVAETAAYFQSEGIAFRQTAEGLSVPPERATGVVLRFV